MSTLGNKTSTAVHDADFIRRAFRAMNNKKRFIHALRWTAFLPAAVAAAFLAWAFIYLCGRLTLSWTGIGSEDFLGKLYFTMAGSCVMSVAFVYVGTIVAPSHRVVVAFVLAGIGILFAGATLFVGLMIRDWWGMLASVVTAVGAGGVVYFIHTGEVDVQ